MRTAKQKSITYYVLRIKYAAIKWLVPLGDQVSSIKYLINSLKLAAIRFTLNAVSGFTLVEILVAATILATLAGGTIFTLNPIAQINKGLDAKRHFDLQSIKVALDTYYSDTKCYPQKVPFGQEWTSADGTAVYMKKVPQDAKCDNGKGTCYNYRTDTASSCPQWNVLFAKLSTNSSLTNVCPLSSLSNCTPPGYSDGVWACTLSGAVNCSALASASSIGGGLETVLPTNTPTPGPTATPTPTPPPPDGSVTYNIGAPAGTNPYIYQATIMPLYQTVGKAQSIQVLANDNSGNITSMKVVLYSDGDARQFTLSKTGGTVTDGTWSGTWAVTNTYYKTYGYDITGVDDKGNTYTARIRINN